MTRDCHICLQYVSQQPVTLLIGRKLPNMSGLLEDNAQKAARGPSFDGESQRGEDIFISGLLLMRGRPTVIYERSTTCFLDSDFEMTPFLKSTKEQTRIIENITPSPSQIFNISHSRSSHNSTRLDCALDGLINVQQGS